MKKLRAKTQKAYTRSGIPVPERPWIALTPSQKEQRLDSVSWSEGHDIFLKDIIEHPVKAIRSRGERSDETGMKLMIRAYKQGVDLAMVPPGTLASTPVEKWASFPRAATLPVTNMPNIPRASAEPPPPPPPAPSASSSTSANPAKGIKSTDFEKILDKIILDHAGPKQRVFKNRKPPPWATPVEPMPWGETPPAEPGTAAEDAGKTPLEFEPARRPGRPSARPMFNQTHLGPRPAGAAAKAGAADGQAGEQGANEWTRRAASNAGAEALGVIPEPTEEETGENTKRDAKTEAAERAARLAEIELIRSKLVVNGRVRLDVEALAVYILMCHPISPSRPGSTRSPGNPGSSTAMR